VFKWAGSFDAERWLRLASRLGRGGNGRLEGLRKLAARPLRLGLLESVHQSNSEAQVELRVARDAQHTNARVPLRLEVWDLCKCSVETAFALYLESIVPAQPRGFELQLRSPILREPKLQLWESLSQSRETETTALETKTMQEKNYSRCQPPFRSREDLSTNNYPRDQNGGLVGRETVGQGPLDPRFFGGPLLQEILTGKQQQADRFQKNRFEVFDKRKNKRGFEHKNDIQELNQQNSSTRFFICFWWGSHVCAFCFKALNIH
jgi:hypothetical protein